MGFEQLLGNSRLKENLRASIGRGRISHCYLISGPEGSGKHTLARLLAAAVQCRGSERPCLSCTACRKVMADTHPDFITVDEPEKKIVPVDLIRQARSDMYVQPNEGDRKIYLFPRAQDMEAPSQNALLKILEEPPAYGVFILLTDNPEKLLPTVRSRCTGLMLQSLPEAELRTWLQREFPEASSEAVSAAISRSGGYLGQAQKLLRDGMEQSLQTQGFVESFIRRDACGLLQVLVPMEKWKRDQLIPVLEEWAELLQQALVCRSGVQVVSPAARELGVSRSPQELLDALRQLQKVIEYARGNVSSAAICGYLAQVLR